jgi:hypothetical protein
MWWTGSGRAGRATIFHLGRTSRENLTHDPPILVIRAAAISDDQVEHAIDDMAECGWVVVSEVVK